MIKQGAIQVGKDQQIHMPDSESNMFTNRMYAMTNAIVETVETGLEQTTLFLEVPRARDLPSGFFLFVYVNFLYGLAKMVLSREE